jgi:F0F1-type ATP synthase assembly protein I
VCKAIPDLSLAGLLPLVKKVILAGIITGAVLYFFAQSLSVTQPFIRFILATMLGFSVYGGTLMLLRSRELMALVGMIGRKLRRK